MALLTIRQKQQCLLWMILLPLIPIWGPIAIVVVLVKRHNQHMRRRVRR